MIRKYSRKFFSPTLIIHTPRQLVTGIFILLISVCIPLKVLAQTNIPPSEVQMNNLSAEQLQQAAEAGDPDAQYALGYLYYYGKNVPQSTQIGLNWIKRASVQGQEQAAQAMQMLAPSNTQKADAQLLAAEDNSQARTNDQQGVEAPFVQQRQPNNMAPAVNQAALAPVKEVPQMKNMVGNYYTIQLLVTSSKDELNRYAQVNALGSKTTYYATKRNGRASYTLLYGTYKTRSEAQASLSELPVAVKAQKPWIKQLNSIK